MLSGLSSQMSGLDKGGGLGHTGTLPEKKDRQLKLFTSRN